MKKLLNRGGIYSFLSSIMAIIIGILIGFVVLLIANSSQALNGLGTILKGGFGNLRNTGQMLYTATPIILTGLSVGFANKCGLFNIGGSGQFIVGAYVAVYIGVKWTFLPGATHWIVALLCAALAGAIWGLVPGLLKAFANVNEVISCIMMNYIGMSFANMMVRRTVYDSKKAQSLQPVSSAVLPKLGMDKIFVSDGAPSSVNAGIVIAIIMGVIMFIVISKTKFGFELKAVGLNRDAAKYAGINEKKSIVTSMAIAGALAALGGGLVYLAGSGKGIEVVDVLAAEGFNGIPVALLGMNNPIGIIFSGMFIAHLTMGGFNLQSFGFVPEVIDIITAVIIYFAAFVLFFQQAMQKVGNKTLSQELEARNGPPEDPVPAPPQAEGGKKR